MATRATFDYKLASIKTFTVASAKVSTTDFNQKLNTDGTIQDAVAGEASIGVAYKSMGTQPAAVAGEQMQVALIQGPGIFRAKVGTGGSTAGKEQVCAIDGVTDAPTLGGGTVLRNIVGIARETGVLGDVIGLIPMRMAAVSA